MANVFTIEINRTYLVKVIPGTRHGC